MDFSGKNTGAGCHFLLQGILLIQGLNPGVLCLQVDSLPLSHLGGLFIFVLLSSFSEVFHCSFIWNIFFHRFILLTFISSY